jgi:hypothetical protein
MPSSSYRHQPVVFTEAGMGPRSRVISDLSFGDDPDDWQGELAAAGYDWPVPNMSSIVGNLARDTGASRLLWRTSTGG